MPRIIFLIVLFIIPCYLSAQIFPKENSQLNYRIAGFSFPKEKGTCTLEIANGHYNTVDSFKKNIIKSIVCKTNKVIAEVPFWGTNYTWQVVNSGTDAAKNELHYFSTLMNANIDTMRNRLRIIKSAEQYKDAYVFIDDSHALYDMKGNAVWFLPNIDRKIETTTAIRDLKITPQGTITFSVVDGNIYEINYDGAILWKGPNTGEISGDSTEHYHHEFTRLGNGHYMVLGNEDVFWELPEYHADSSNNPAKFGIVRDSNNVYRQKLTFGTVIEYDEQGNVVWSWKSADYFKNSDLAGQKTTDGRFRIEDTHDNSFFFDEENNNIYVSYKNISRILKIKYPEGNVLAAYGTKYAPGLMGFGTDLFCGQHSVKHSKFGYLYLFNNNSCVHTNLPKIEIMQEPDSGTGALKMIWEYQCTLEGMSDSERSKYDKQIEHTNKNLKAVMNRTRLPTTTGGNVIELPDQSMFVSSSGVFSNIFIVNKDKKILWSSVFEMWIPTTKNWKGKNPYRASIIPNHKDLEQMIWNTEEPSRQR